MFISLADFSGVDLTGDMGGLSVNGAELFQTDLSKAHMHRASLTGSNVGGSNLSKADLRDASLFNTRINEANLVGADLSSANLHGVDLSKANLSEANLSGAYDDPPAKNMTADSFREIMQQADSMRAAGLSQADIDKAFEEERISPIPNEEIEAQTKLLKGATMPNGQKYEDWLKSEGRAGRVGEHQFPVTTLKTNFAETRFSETKRKKTLCAVAISQIHSPLSGRK